MTYEYKLKFYLLDFLNKMCIICIQNALKKIYAQS